MKTLITPEIEKIIREHYSSKGGVFCEKLTGIKRTTIVNYCHKHKIRIDKNVNHSFKLKALELGRKAPRKEKSFDSFSVNPEHFLNIQTKEVAYILGLLWADGNIFSNRVSIEMIQSDMLDIEKIFDYVGAWRKSKRKRKNQQATLTVHIGNKHIAKFLIEHDFGPRRTVSPNKILDKIPKELRYYFFRGLFDGDGCVFFKKYKRVSQYMFICGNFYQDWDFVEKLYQTLGIEYKIIRRKQIYKNKPVKHNASLIRIYKKDSLRKFINYLYKDYDNMGIKRKYEKSMQILENM